MIKMKFKYRQIDPRIWNDAKFCSLSGDAKLVFLFLLTHIHLTSLGAMRGTCDGIICELKSTLQSSERNSNKYLKGFHEVLSKGLIKYDENSNFIWLPNFLKYNPPQSPNTVKAWEKALYYLPECELKIELIQHVKAYAEALTEGFRLALPKAFDEALMKGIPEGIHHIIAKTSVILGTRNKELRKEKEIKKKKKIFDYVKYAEEFLEIYPNPTNRIKVFKLYQQKVKNLETHEKILDGVRHHKLEHEWVAKYPGSFKNGWWQADRFINEELWKETKTEDYYRENSSRTVNKCYTKGREAYQQEMQGVDNAIADKFDQ